MRRNDGDVRWQAQLGGRAGQSEPAGAPHSSSSGSSSADALAAARPLCHNPSLCG
ncbi:MAG: hypothetical protein ACLRZH_05815 [Ruthenibacterium lactatiformans]